MGNFGTVEVFVEFGGSVGKERLELKGELAQVSNEGGEDAFEFGAFEIPGFFLLEKLVGLFDAGPDVGESQVEAKSIEVGFDLVAKLGGRIGLEVEA